MQTNYTGECSTWGSFLWVLFDAAITVRAMIAGYPLWECALWFVAGLMIGVLMLLENRRRDSETAQLKAEVVRGNAYQSGKLDVIAVLAERAGVSLPQQPNEPSLSLSDYSRRPAILQRLRQLYALTHSGLSHGLLDGTEPLPKEWTELQLEKMGETWRQDKYL